MQSIKQIADKFKKALPLLMVVVVLGGQSLFVTQAKAAEEKERKYADVKTKQRQAVGASCAKRLEKVQEVLSGDTEPTKQQLASLVRDLPSYTAKECSSSYEKSNVYNMLGYVHYLLDQYPQAISAYVKMINEPDVDERQKLATRYTVAQLYMIQENYKEAVRQLEQWMKESDIIGDDAKILLAQGYYQLERKTEALRLVDEVVNEAEKKGELPKESWWSFQRVLYYEKDDYRKVVDILKKLVTNYPKLTYWQQLGGMYGQLEQEMNQLVSTEVVYLQKGLTKDRQLLSLAYMYLGANVPYEAARIIEKGMAEGTIPKNGKNLEILGSAWQQAQSFDKAADILEQAAKLSGKGEIYARLASVYLDQDQNVKAAKAAQNAISKGGLKRPELTYLALGSARINLHCYTDAVKAFREAAKNKKTSKTANQWISYAKNEGDRRTKLIKSGANIATCTKV